MFRMLFNNGDVFFNLIISVLDVSIRWCKGDLFYFIVEFIIYFFLSVNIVFLRDFKFNFLL